MKWSDRVIDRGGEGLKHLLRFATANGLEEVTCTTRTRTGIREIGGIRVRFLPAAVYCFTIGHNLVARGAAFPHLEASGGAD